MNQLKGHKILIIGNHDAAILKNPEAIKCFDSIESMLEIYDRDKKICLCHYPLAEWNGEMRGTWHIFGHIHSNTNGAYEYMKTKKHALNAGCMLNNWAPVTFEELVVNNKKFQEANEVCD